MRWWLPIVALSASCDGQVRFDADDADTADVSAIESSADTAPAPCMVDGDCPFASLHCDPISHSCVACLVDAQCAAHSETPRCDSTTHVCVECDNDKECGSSGTCDASHCLRSCFDVDDCSGETPACNPTRKVCTCTSSSCTSSERPRCEASIGICVECIGDGDCRGDHPRCVRGECVHCTLDADCSGRRCDPVVHECVD